ncbi:uncharacterized protein LOC135095991 isoform X1 [Scylla paramamosain]|uniref:uncharacterized protein LOC135095991 isoform X1 n=2 Tax=Scylla paramamosain TaxID=85552 RepID=UPI00308284AB
MEEKTTMAGTDAMEEEKRKGEEGEEDDKALPANVSLVEVEVRHAKALLECAGNMTLDVARCILGAHFRTLRATRTAGLRRLTGGFIQCPSCSTPWIADLCRPRILGCPRNKRNDRKLRRVLRLARTNSGKLTKSDKSLLSRFQDRLNVVQVLCHVCRHKKEEFFALPKKEKVQEVEVEKSKKKKKKKKGKEINAGLFIPPRSVGERSNGGRENESIFSASKTDDFTPDAPESTLERTKNTLDHCRKPLCGPKNSLGSQKVTLAAFKPRKKSARVILNSVPCQPTPAPAKRSRERKRTVANLKRVMGKESDKSELFKGGGKNQNSLRNFLDSLF